MNCLKCGSRTQLVTDIDGETLPECLMCGFRGYKTPEQLGIDVTIAGDILANHE